MGDVSRDEHIDGPWKTARVHGDSLPPRIWYDIGGVGGCDVPVRGRYHCLAPDLPGHGDNRALPWRSLFEQLTVLPH